MQLYVEKVNISSLDNDQIDVILVGYDIDQVVSEIGTVNLLDHLDYGDLVEYVARIEKEKKEDAEYDR